MVQKMFNCSMLYGCVAKYRDYVLMVMDNRNVVVKEAIYHWY